MGKPLKNFVVKSMVVGMLLSSASFIACSKGPSAEQLQALAEQERAAKAAEDKLAEKKSERDELKRQLEEKKAELKKAETEKENVKQRLEQMEGQN